MNSHALLKLQRSEVVSRPVHLEWFNDLSKSLFMSFYYFFSRRTDLDADLIRAHIASAFGAKVLKIKMAQVAQSIGAKVLGASEEDFVPHGASALMLLADSSEDHYFHLDKSHMSTHTYPNIQYSDDLAVLRVDFELSTCGEINPLACVPELLADLNPDLISLDFAVRGVTRKNRGPKQYMETGCAEIVSTLMQGMIRDRYELSGESMPQHRFWKFHLERKEKVNLYQHSIFKKSLHSYDFIDVVNQEIQEIKACQP